MHGDEKVIEQAGSIRPRTTQMLVTLLTLPQGEDWSMPVNERDCDNFCDNAGGLIPDQEPYRARCRVFARRPETIHF
jgi:hypothetical protein